MSKYPVWMFFLQNAGCWVSMHVRLMNHVIMHQQPAFVGKNDHTGSVMYFLNMWTHTHCIACIVNCSVVNIFTLKKSHYLRNNL